MNYKLSIIIAHYLPNTLGSINPLIKTLSIINQQKENFNIEVIVADDGSKYSKQIITNHSRLIEINNSHRKLYCLEDNKLNQFLEKLDISKNLIDKWIYLPKDKPCMSKAKVINYSVKLSSSENLLFLDDDNYFVSQKSISNLLNLFNTYDFIIGQIIDNNNRKRLYKSNRVQGTTIAIKKDIFNSIKGFGEWTEEYSCGIDSDFWLKLYSYYIKNQFNACYTDQISTYDSFSKRWGKYTKIFGDFKLKKAFKKLYGCKNYKNKKHNLSRNKKLWIKNLVNE